MHICLGVLRAQLVAVLHGQKRIFVRLFSRTGRKSVLAEAGERYCEMIHDEVERITIADEGMRGFGLYTVFSVRIAPTFATKWTLTRLDEFLSFYPDIELRLDATSDPKNFGQKTPI